MLRRRDTLSMQNRLRMSRYVAELCVLPKRVAGACRGFAGSRWLRGGFWRRGLAGVLLCVLLAASPIDAVEAPVGEVAPSRIRVAADNNFPPWLYRDGDGKLRGFIADEWRLFEQHTGIEVELEGMQWGQVQDALRSGRADVIDMIYRTPERESLYDFSAPYATLPVGIYVDRRILGVKDVASLRGLPVAVERGDACIEMLQAQGITDLREYPDYQQLVQAALQEDLRVLCMDQSPANYFLYRNRALDRFSFAFVLYTGQFHRAVRKGDLATLRAVEHGMSLISAGERAELKERWLSHPFVLRPWLRLGGLLAGGVLLLLLLGLGWVLALRRSVRRRTDALHAEQRKLRALFNAIPDAVLVKDRAGILRDSNDHALALWGLSRGDYIGRHGATLFDADVALKIQAMDEQVMGENAPLNRTLSVPSADGRERRLDVSKVPLHGEDGAVSGTLTVIRDISERIRMEAQLRLWAHAFRHAAFAVAIYDVRSERIVAVNDTFARERGYDPEEMIGMAVASVYPPERAAELIEARRRGELHTHSVHESEHVTRDGRRFPVQLDRSLLRDEDGRPQYGVVYVQDISERKRTEHELRLAAAAFRTQDAAMVLDADGVIRRVNEAFVALTGYRSSEVLGHRPGLLSNHRSPSFRERMLEQVRSAGAWRGEQWIEVKEGDPRVVRVAVSAVRDSEGELSHYVCSMVDLTTEREASASIDRMTFFDPLTELPNRNFLQARVQHLLDSGAAGSAALLMLDLDHFKQINELRGHLVGDQLLLRVARRLRACFDEDIVVARFGGGTYVLLVPDPPNGAEASAASGSDRLSSRALLCAERVRESLSESFEMDDGPPIRITASIGWTPIGTRNSFDSLLTDIELAMYAAKEAGRDRIRRFDESMRADLRRHEALAGELSDAVHSGARGFTLHFQPEVNRDGRVVGAEVLLRWTRGDGQLVPPDVFIPIAEERGLILALGGWVKLEACRVLARWAESPLTENLFLAVNVSGKQLLHAGFLSGVQRILQETGADPSLLKLEITENVVLGQLSEVADKLRELRGLGIRVLLDDFGTGYSSLSYLSRLPLDELKIDRSFIAELDGSETGVTLVRTLISMGRALGLGVVAEGLETEAQRRFLMDEGCDLLQGFLLARPMPEAAFLALLAAHRAAALEAGVDLEEDAPS